MKNTMTDEQLDNAVLYFLSKPTVTEANRIDRWALVEQVFGERVPEALRNDDHPLDRDIRESVRRLRDQGHLICDMGDGKGRWIAKTNDEFKRFYKYFVKPISAKAVTARAMLKAAKTKFPDLLQPSLFDAVPEFDDVLSVL